MREMQKHITTVTCPGALSNFRCQGPRAAFYDGELMIGVGGGRLEKSVLNNVLEPILADASGLRPR